MRASFNTGKIRPMMTVFGGRDAGRAGEPRVWNTLLLSYAGYGGRDGAVVGDPANIAFTEFCSRLGWAGPGGSWDLLPVVVSGRDGLPHWFSVPEELSCRVEITHPTCPAISQLGLQWPGLPLVGGLMLEVGGIQVRSHQNILLISD